MCASAAAYLNDTVRQRTLALLGRAYSTLRLTDAAVFLGLSEAETAGGASTLAVCSSPLLPVRCPRRQWHRPGGGFGFSKLNEGPHEEAAAGKESSRML